MMRVIAAGIAYFTAVFALGFLLGTMRTLWLAEMLGESMVILLEIPVILIFSWVVAGWIIAWLDVPPKAGVRLAMGGIAFALLMLGELSVGMGLQQLTFTAHLEGYLSMKGMAGLSGQIIFALMPLLRLRTQR